MSQTRVAPSPQRRRLEAIFAGQEPDRLPVLGGWIASAGLVAAIAGVSKTDYWADPQGVSLRAYERLEMDGLIGIFIPQRGDEYRCVDEHSYAKAHTTQTLEDVVAQIDAMDGPERIEAAFAFEEEYAKFRASLIAEQAACGDLVWLPAQWTAGAKLTWFFDFGYELFFQLIGLHPDRAQKLMEIGGARGHCLGRLVGRAVTEGLYPHAILLGEDICTQRGPMVSPAWLGKCWQPQLRYGLEPLLAAGCRPVWHCDGNVRPLLDMLLDAGVQGLQGFQPECGMKLTELVQRRTRDGETLVIFGPLAVTTELPVMTPGQVRDAVRRARDICRGQARLVLFTSNTINPDIPLANVRALYDPAVR